MANAFSSTKEEEFAGLGQSCNLPVLFKLLDGETVLGTDLKADESRRKGATPRNALIQPFPDEVASRVQSKANK